jgi:hypothetical protein
MLHMPNQEDYLDRVWIKVINLDPNGSWIERCLHQSGNAQFAAAGAALKRTLLHKPSFEDLGRLFRFVRYQATAAGLRALEHPGLKSGKVRGLHRQLELARSFKPARAVSERDFIGSLWKIIAPDADGAWMKSLAQNSDSNEAFGDVPPSVKRLLKKGINAADLEQVAVWHRYDAMFELFRLMEEEGFYKVTEIPGLHEILLGLEPSGKEGRPGSWPFLRSLG